MKLTREKIDQAIAILDEKNVDLWLTFVRETSNNPDPILDLIFGSFVTWHSAFIITRSGDTTAIVGSMEVPNTEQVGVYDEVIGYVGSVKAELLKAIQHHDPKRIAVNYSVHSVMADGLSHGMWLTLNDYFDGTPYAARLESSEQIVAALRGRKSATELARISTACDIAQEIFDLVTDFLKPGVTEKQVAAFMLEQVEKRGLDTSWDRQHCPAVFTGPDTAGAHAGPTDRAAQPGHILNIDFGVNKDDYCSDLQRTWYFLRDGESAPPPAVTKGFNTIVEAIQKAADAVRPGKVGHEIDQVARGHIVNQGYEEYPHALGHQVGRVAHDGGGLLAPKWERYGNLPDLPIEKDQVYTLEPRLTVEGHGIATVEEEIVVTDDGCRYLSKPQKEIYLVG